MGYKLSLFHNRVQRQLCIMQILVIPSFPSVYKVIWNIKENFITSMFHLKCDLRLIKHFSNSTFIRFLKINSIYVKSSGNLLKNTDYWALSPLEILIGGLDQGSGSEFLKTPQGILITEVRHTRFDTLSQ